MSREFDFDVLVVGSGFGGSVSALRLTEKRYRLAVLESGRRYEANDFPKSNWNVRKFFFFPRLGLHGIQRIDLLSNVLVLSGAGVGGGSLVYANTLYRPLDPFYSDPQWAHITDWRAELEPFYDQASAMLGVTKARGGSPNDHVIEELGRRMGVADTFKTADVGVYVGRAGETDPDPFFGGVGPDRTGCIECGGCMVGCRHNAKNSLDRNYLYLAEQAGATVLPQRLVTEVSPLPGGGYEVVSERPGPLRGRTVRRHRAQHVVLSAGVLGTVRLLADQKERGRLPNLSPRLGELTRTNSESIPGARANGFDVDYSTGIAISSSIYPDSETHIEGVRYPVGSNAMALLATTLVDGGGRVPRQLRFLAQSARHPIRLLRSLSVRRWAERSVILLVMQSRDNSINLRWRAKRRGVKLRSEQGIGEPNPNYIPVANEAARLAADIIDGEPFGSVNEALLNVPVTAHILGGCVIGDSAETGVVDGYQRVFGHPGLHIADGSTISANLGVNPSLTITAQTERAMSFWPNKGELDRRPPLGSPYRRLDPVAPEAAVVPAGVPAALRW